MKFNEFLTRVVNDCIEGPEAEHSGAHLCDECEGEDGAHEPGCRTDPDWEPSDDDLDLNGERNGAEAERRALRDAGRDGGVW